MDFIKSQIVNLHNVFSNHPLQVLKNYLIPLTADYREIQNTNMQMSLIKAVIKLTLFLKIHHHLTLVKSSIQKDKISCSTHSIIKIF